MIQIINGRIYYLGIYGNLFKDITDEYLIINQLEISDIVRISFYSISNDRDIKIKNLLK